VGRASRQFALLEQVGQQGKAQQQQQQVAQRDPLVAGWPMKPPAGTGLEGREQDLVKRDQNRTPTGDAQRVVVKQGHPGQHAAEEDELQRHRTDLRAGKGAITAWPVPGRAGKPSAAMPQSGILIGSFLLRRILGIAA
jgi:hypothetical protein